MPESCRICGRDLCGQQRRWLFRRLQVLLSHALGRALQRDGRREFICSKCGFMLDRMFRFDTVMARVEALSLQRLRRLLLEKESLRRCIRAQYSRSNPEEEERSGADAAPYRALLQLDLTYAMHESWAEPVWECQSWGRSFRAEPVWESRSWGRSFRGLRVSDSDYEAVCKVPRRLARSRSCGPSSRCSGELGLKEQTSATLMPDRRCTASSSADTLRETRSSGGSRESWDEEPQRNSSRPELFQHWVYKPVQSPRGSRLPVRVNPGFFYGGATLDSPDQRNHIMESERELQWESERESVPESERESVLESERESVPELLRESERESQWESERESERELQWEPERESQWESERESERELQWESERESQRESEWESERESQRESVPESQRGSEQESVPESQLESERGSEQESEQESVPESEHESQRESEQGAERESERGSERGSERELQLELWEDEFWPFYFRRIPQSLMEEQQSQRHQDDQAAQCVAELQNAQLQVESLQTQIQLSETSNKKLQEKVCEMESELLSIREAAQSQQRTIQNLTDSLRTKDTETQELYHVIEDQNNTLCKLTESHQQQLQHTQAPEDSVLLHTHTHTHLFSCQLELEASQRDHRLTQRRLEDLKRSQDRLQDDLRDALEHRESTLKHNQELCEMLEALRAELQVKACALREHEDISHSEISGRDETIGQLQQSLRRKDALLQEYSKLAISSGTSERDTLLHALRTRVRDRDTALERSIDEKFRCLEEKDAEVHRLQLVLREKDRDLERLRCVLNNTNDTVTGLDALVRSKELELERTLETCRKLEWMKQQSDEKLTLAVRERDSLIQQLQTALHTHSKDTEELRSGLLGKMSSADVLLELQAHLSGKERLFQEVMSERSRQLQEHHRQLSELLNTISSRDQDMKDYGARLGRVISERSAQLQELRRQLSSREQELHNVNRERERDASAARDLQRLQNLLKEKDFFIQELLQGQSEVLSSTAQAVCMSSSGDLEIQAIRDELQLTLRKQRETECVLQQLVTEQQALNEALRAEKSLYQSLRHVQGQEDSSEKARALHNQLDSLQAVREQLDQSLARSRETALMLDRAEYGESSSDEEDPDSSSSEEFTDSIEDDDIKLTAQSLTSSQKAEEYGQLVTSQNASEGRRCEEAEQSNQDECETVEATVQPDDSWLREPEDVCVRSQGLEKHEADRRNSHGSQRVYRTFPEEEEEEEEYDDEEEDVRATQGKRGPPCVKLRGGRWKKRCTRPHSLDLGALLSHTPAAQDVEMEREVEGDSSGSSTRGGGAVGFWQHVEAGLREQAERLRSDLAVSRQESHELQERLMVSEATVHAQAEQLKDYRELLTESAVQRDSKQVQVDLQDLGYETSGRSENEAERDDASSPEFGELEMSVSVAGGRGWQTDEPSSLQGLVQDLRAQLSRCHKVIRGLQLRVRSLSTTSDYASSLERTPRKVNWALTGVDEDEGWQSDGPQRPSPELQELVSRVAVLETQIRSSKLEGKSGPEEGKCATWPGKYNTLIQAQARELSHLRQKMREGRGVVHILTQHLSDTTKAFEELLRANDIDYYMAQSFREQLSQSSSLAQRVSSKISGRDRSEQRDDKAGHELLALRLSKELQHKDQIIKSLHTRLQKRHDTPCSSHAPSETTDQSDCISFMSDERGSTNEDELCSDMDAASEFAQEEPEPKDAFSAPHSLSSYQLTTNTPHSGDYTPLSHHPLGKSGGPSVQTDALWDMENMIQPIRGFDGSSYYPSGNSQSDVIEEHLREIRSLRQRLEDSIRTNERLRQQLEGRLAIAARDTVAPTNIFIQSHDAVSQLTNEVRALKEENLALQSRLQASRDSSEEAEQLREAVLSGRVRLQQAELEAEQWKEELRRLQKHNCEQSQQIQQLRQDRQNSQEHNNRLQHEVSLLHQQLAESRQLLHSLQGELRLYDRVCGVRKSVAAGFACEEAWPSVELGELLVEVRALRAQLELSVQENSALRATLQKQLDHPSAIIPASPLRDVLYRRQLLHDPSPSPPVRDVGPFPAGPLYSPYSEVEETNDSLEPHADLEGEAPDGSFSSPNGRHAVGHVDDYGALQQQVLEGRALVQRMEAGWRSLNTALLEKALDYSTVKALLTDTKTLHQILDEAVSLLKMFWRAALPSSDGPVHLIQREQSMREEIQLLRLRITEQEEVLQGTIQRLRCTSRTKESMETFIVNQLSRTRDVLKKARANLEKNELRISCLSSSSSSLCHGKASRARIRVTPACPEIAMETAGLQQPQFLQLTASR